MSIRCLLVDDEPRARKGLRARLLHYPDIQIVGECASGYEAVDSIHSLKPDLLFLDIQMPGLNGFEVLKQSAETQMPVTIFITAYDRYAVKAFECHALDYLLKPIAENRLREALTHAMTEIEHRNHELYIQKIQAILLDYSADFENPHPHTAPLPLRQKPEFLSRLMIKTVNTVIIVPVDDIYWIESAADLVFIHTHAKKYVLRETLTSLEGKLDPKQFIRIHRSAIVNVKRIKQLCPVSHGDFNVHLENDTKLRLSRTYRSKFQNILQRG
jgi:two-component system LytT family response regulator